MGSVGVQVHATVEHSSSILSDCRRNQSFATGVVFDEIGYIMKNAGDGNQSLAILRLLNEVIPVNDRKLLQRHTPVKLGTLLVKLLLLLLQTALVDFVLAESLEIRGETKLLPGPNAPLGGVILVPPYRVAVVRRELVVEVVVSFSKGNKGGDDVVARAVAIIKRLLTEPVGKGVDAESRLLNHKDTQNSGVDKSADPIAPAKASDEGREDESHEENTLHEVPVLPNDNRVLVQVRDIGTANSLGVLLHDHPADVAVQEAFANRVGILLSVGVSVVSAMTILKKRC